MNPKAKFSINLINHISGLNRIKADLQNNICRQEIDGHKLNTNFESESFSLRSRNKGYINGLDQCTSKLCRLHLTYT
jgi:hypothetical protein